MPRDRRLRHVEDRHQIADADLAFSREVKTVEHRMTFGQPS
jgi:hypothetical protein